MNNRLIEFINSAKPQDLINWLNENPSLLSNSVDVLMKKMSKACITRTSSMLDCYTLDDTIALLHSMYDNRDNISENEFKLFETFCKSTMDKLMESDTLGLSIPPGEVAKNPILALFTLMTPMEYICNGVIDNANGLNCTGVVQIYMWIMDIYIPYNDPEGLVTLFNNAFSFKEIILNVSNTEWFTKVYNEKELFKSYPLKEMLLLFKYVSDIYLNREQRFSFFEDIHTISRTYYKFSKDFRSVENRYSKYFEDDTAVMISDVKRISDSSYNSLDSEIDEFLYTWSDKYSEKANKEVIKCFLNDSISLIIKTHPMDNVINKEDMIYSKLRDDISGLWGDSKYHIDEVISDYTDDSNTPISYLETFAMEAIHKDSVAMNDAGKKIYKAYKTYKNAEEKVDSQLTKAAIGIKNVVTGDVKTEIIEGKKFSAISLLKKLLGTVAIFSYSKIAAIVLAVTKYALKKTVTVAERKKILLDLETEIELITEKINDARGDNNREAKYAMMRTKKELENAYKRIQYGLEADTKSVNAGRMALQSARNMKKS